MTEDASSTSRHAFVVRFLAGFLLVFLTTAVVTFLLPEIYSSTARLEVGAAGTKAGETDPAFIRAQVEALRSREVLHPVIERLKLNENYARRSGAPGPLQISESYEVLSQSLLIRSMTHSSLIEIRVFSQDAGEAADTANAIATVFRDAIGRPKGWRVAVVDPAAPNRRPVRPNIPLNIAVGAFLGAATGILFGGIGWFWARRRAASPPDLGGAA